MIKRVAKELRSCRCVLGIRGKREIMHIIRECKGREAHARADVK